MIISLPQIRAARALLDWSQKDLAERAGISDISVINIERGKTSPQMATMEKIMAAFRDGGVEFQEDRGVILSKGKVVTLQGVEGFRAFMEDVYETARDFGGDMCLHNAVPVYWDKFLGQDWIKMHAPRMMEIKDRYTLRITCPKGEEMPSTRTYAEYRAIPLSIFNDRGFYCYGKKIAFLDFEENDVNIYVLNHQQFADGFRRIFDIMWDQVAEPVQDNGK